MKKWVILFLYSFFILLWMGGCATQKHLPSLSLAQQGALPHSGRVIIRSGLQWMPENAPLFQRLSASLTPLLEQRGLTLVSVSPTITPPLPGSPASQTGSAPSRHSVSSRTGKHIPLRLDSYAIPQKDADLPPSVMRIQPIDADTVLFALSQKKGIPTLALGAALPAYVPPEIHTKDAQKADFVVVCRFAVQGGNSRVLSFISTPPQQFYSPSSYIADLVQSTHESPPLSGVAVAAARMPMTAGSIRGVNTLGYGSAAPPARPQPAYGGTPGDYARGHEGMTNTGDPWHREHDMNARDYTLRYGEPPSYASPPQTDSATSSSVIVSPNLPSLPRAPLPGEGTAQQQGEKKTTPAARSGAGQEQGSPATSDAVILLEIACYSLAPVRQGLPPQLVWQGSARQANPESTLMHELPRMVQQLLEKNT